MHDDQRPYGTQEGGDEHLGGLSLSDGCEDRVADKLGDLRDYGVSEGAYPHHPSGNPINHSWRFGFTRPLRNVPRRAAARLELLPPAFDEPLDRGVGKNSRDPNSVSDMGGAKVGSLKAMPDSIIPERGQVTEDATEPFAVGSRKQLWDVFHERESGSNFANETGVLTPETGAFAINARSATSLGEVLAGEPAADDIDGNSIGSKSFAGEFSNVMVAGHLGPAFRQDLAAERVDFAECDSLEPASPLEPQVEAADACEQGKDAQLAHPAPSQGISPSSFAGGSMIARTRIAGGKR